MPSKKVSMKRTSKKKSARQIALAKKRSLRHKKHAALVRRSRSRRNQYMQW